MEMSSDKYFELELRILNIIIIMSILISISMYVIYIVGYVVFKYNTLPFYETTHGIAAAFIFILTVALIRFSRVLNKCLGLD